VIRLPSRLRLLIGALAVVSLLVPQSALASPSEDSCAAYRAFIYTMPLPDAMRTPGVHGVRWHNEFIDPDGVLQVLDTEHQIEIVPGAPLYAGEVLVRVFSTWGALPGRDVDFHVQQIDPAQPASLYVATNFLAGSPNAETDRTWVSWETDPGVWTERLELRHGPETNDCALNFSSLFRRSFGWIG
jgi:hypothetical protein